MRVLFIILALLAITTQAATTKEMQVARGADCIVAFSRAQGFYHNDATRFDFLRQSQERAQKTTLRKAKLAGIDPQEIQDRVLKTSKEWEAIDTKNKKDMPRLESIYANAVNACVRDGFGQ